MGSDPTRLTSVVSRDIGDSVCQRVGLIAGCASTDDRVDQAARSGLERDDGDLPLVDDRQHPAARMGRTDVEVLQTACAAQRDRGPAVGGVAAETEVACCATPGRL